MSHMYPEGAPVGFEDQSHIGEPNEKPRCNHEPDGANFDRAQHAFIISECEKCGAPLRAAEIDTELLQKTGELHVTKWTESEHPEQERNPWKPLTD